MVLASNKIKIGGLVLGAIFLLLLFLGAEFGFPVPGESRPAESAIDFNKDVRPILNENCTECHGGVMQAGDVSFIFRDQVLGAGKSGRPIVIPGRPNASEMITRITSSDPSFRMPLDAPALPPEKVAVLEQWIEEGAPWEDYWSFVPPKRPALPDVEQEEWVRHPLDRFVLARLEKESMRPSPEASKTELLRRVSFDLTGLPPTPEELSAFLSDSSADAYEKQVDRLLGSSSYGERWASLWLDLARYADSKGLVTDLERPGVWVYRDWLIDALNDNLSYRDFIIKQLAGDLLPDATLEDFIATSFHRQTLANDEGGTDNEEFRVVATMDRVATTWSVLNGITMNCVQCHSHPYDPIQHTEYFTSLAYFNTSRDADLAWFSSILEPDDDWPVIHVPLNPSLRDEIWLAQKETKELHRKITETSRRLAEDRSQWSPLSIEHAEIDERLGIERGIRRLSAFAKETPEEEATRLWIYENKINILEERRSQIVRSPPDALKFDIQGNVAHVPDRQPPYNVVGLRVSTGEPVVTALLIEAPPANPTTSVHTPEKGFVVTDVEASRVLPDGSAEEIALRFVAPDSEDSFASSMAQALRSENAADRESSASSDLMSRLAKNSVFSAYPNHFRNRWIVAVPDEPIRMPSGAALRIQLTNMGAPLNSVAMQIQRVAVSASADPRWTEFANSNELESDILRLARLARRVNDVDTVPVPIMREQPPYARRATLKFDRGNYLMKVGPAMLPGVPKSLDELPDEAQPKNRLELAEWFFSPNQPLTARVAVNRYFEQLFGTGLVETLEDFGSVGDIPSHPELLDWLALRFKHDLQWDVKALLREIVTSATYRQSSVVSPLLRDKDPRNRLLARGPRQRLTAEMVRDQALLASGLLTSRIGGPPVMPPQPDGVWSGFATFSGASWIDATGPDRYRRAVYTFIKRTTSYPSFLTFDASDHQVSLARRIPTNTPLQALVTLNDTVYREAAVALADRMREKMPESADEDGFEISLNYGARRVLSRDLNASELSAVRKLYNTLTDEADGEESDALVEVASTLLNLDASMTR